MGYSTETAHNPVRSEHGSAGFHHNRYAVGTTGAITATTGLQSAVTLARSSAGVYTVTLPKARQGLLIIQPTTDTAVSWKVTAFSATSGTATIEFMDAAGAAVELASGDSIGVLYYAECL